MTRPFKAVNGTFLNLFPVLLLTPNLRMLAFFLVLPLFFAADAPAEGGRLDLPFKAGVSMLLENNLDLGVRRIEPRISHARVLSALGGFDPEIFGSFAKRDTSTPLGARSSVAAGGLRSIESESYGLQAGITGKTGFGAVYTLSSESSWTADTFSGFDFEYESFTGVSLRQPLLRGFGDANLLAIRLARKDMEVSEQQLRRALLDAVSLYGGAWWALMDARGALDVRIESLKLAEVLLEVNRKKYASGAISRIELVQAEAAAALRKEDVLTAEKAVLRAGRELKELIAGDAYAMKDTELVPVGDGALKPVKEDLRESVSRALESRPEYIEAKSTLESSRIRERYSKNQAHPAVDLEAGYGYSGLGDSFSESFSNLDSNPEWRLGLVFRYPLGNRAASGELEAAGLEALRSRIRLKRLEQEIVLRLDQSLKEISTDRERLAVADDAVRLAEETLSAEEKRLDAGRSTTFNVLRIQEDLLQARLNRLDAVSDYNTALLWFYREKGTLLEELGIDLENAAEVK